MKQFCSLLRSGFLASLLLLLPMCGNAQAPFSKTLFLNKDNARQLIGVSGNDSIIAVGAVQDATGISATVVTENASFSYGYDGNSWRNQLSSSLVYDTGIYPSDPYMIREGGRNALISSDRYSSDPFSTLYISDGTTARSVVRNADWGNLNPQTFYATALSFNNENVTIMGTSDISNFDHYLLYKQGNERLRVLNSSPLHDPRDTRYIEQINAVFPTSRGFAVQAVSAYGDTVYEYRNGGLVPLFDSSTDYFGDGEASLFGSIRPSVNPQDGILFQYNSAVRDENGYGFYRDGLFVKVAYSGEILPNNAGKIVHVSDGWLDNGDIILSAVLENPNPTLEETALLSYHNGELSLIDRFIYGGQFAHQIYLNGFVNGSFLASLPVFDDGTPSSQAQIYRYSLVPEPGTLALILVSAISGIYLLRRSRRLGSRRITGIR